MSHMTGRLWGVIWVALSTVAIGIGMVFIMYRLLPRNWMRAIYQTVISLLALTAPALMLGLVSVVMIT